MGYETMGKKDREKKKKQKQQEKQEKREDRKLNNNKGKNLDDMIAYIDENGNLSDTPPDMRNKKEMKLEDIQLGAAKPVETDPAELVRTGIVKLFNYDKGFGFITDLKSQESVFVHSSDMLQAVNVQDKVTFEMGRGPKGPKAINVKKA